MLVAGDDRTDEDMMRVLCELSPGPPTAAEANAANGGKSSSKSSTPSVPAHCAAASCPAPNSAPLVLAPPAPLGRGAAAGEPKTLALRPAGIWTCRVGLAETLAHWHVPEIGRAHV